MTHEHHHHERTVTSLNKAFILGIALNVAFVVVEFAVGLSYGSMGLLSDAGHNLSDVASLLLAMLAFRLAQAQATPRYTYGYKKSTVLISLLNSVILLIAVGGIVAESIGRMLHPAPVEGGAIAWTAGVGVAINGFTAWLFLKDKDRDLNVKGAYLHMAADALVSVGVLVSGLVISWTGWTIVDPVVGLVVAAVIVASVWSLTRARRRSRGDRRGRNRAEDDGRSGREGRSPHPCLGYQYDGKRPDGPCRARKPVPYGGGETRSERPPEPCRNLPCDARIRVRGRAVRRPARLICPSGPNRSV
jgi:Co/Zn/Cd efflux system component